MSIIINGNQLSENGDYVMVNNKPISEVVANGVTVWKKVTQVPFYWVLEQVVQPGYSLTWTQDSAQNAYLAGGASATPTNIPIASTGGENGSVTIHSNSVSTQKNKTIEIIYDTGDAGGAVYVVGNNSGQTRVPINTYTVDISNDDTIYLIATPYAYAKSSGFIRFRNIRLY